jgi:hypothetical protein
MSIAHGFRDAFAITPSDTVNMTRPCEAIYVGGASAGNVVVVMPSGDVATFVAVPIGTILPVKAKRVNSTGTTVGTPALLALWGA